jgi:hypothetical protein
MINLESSKGFDFQNNDEVKNKNRVSKIPRISYNKSDEISEALKDLFIDRSNLKLNYARKYAQTPS